MKKSHLAFLIFWVLFFGTPSAHAAGDIEVVPLDYDFGNIDIGTSVATLVRVSNIGSSSLTVQDITFQAGSSTDFAITPTMTLPRTISARGFFDVEITFTPSTAAISSAVLAITSLDPDEPLVLVALSGTGVGGEVTPMEQIDTILDFIKASIADGSLVGSGPGKSAKGRLKALVNMVKRTRDLIEAESFEEACHQLQSAYAHTDGQNRPPDFVAGNAATDLAAKIQELLETLACD